MLVGLWRISISPKLRKKRTGKVQIHTTTPHTHLSIRSVLPFAFSGKTFQSVAFISLISRNSTPNSTMALLPLVVLCVCAFVAAAGSLQYLSSPSDPQPIPSGPVKSLGRVSDVLAYPPQSPPSPSRESCSEYSPLPLSTLHILGEDRQHDPNFPCHSPHNTEKTRLPEW
jgi:hypothetical protein